MRGGGPPVGIPCPACNGQFFTTSLPIHQKTCFQRNAFINVACPNCRTQVQSGRYHSHLETCPGVPITPVISDSLVLNREVPEHEVVEELNEPEADGRIRCRKCDRAFQEDRILKHQTVCAGVKRKTTTRPIARKDNQPVIHNSTPATTTIQLRSISRGAPTRSIGPSPTIKPKTPFIPYQPRDESDKHHYDLVHRDYKRANNGIQHLSTSTVSSSSNPLATTNFMTVATLY